ncbi:MAG: hypothetical protein AVDCRST_MAG89-3979, partial [uncultured Gemmatimonadetes bacterium]
VERSQRDGAQPARAPHQPVLPDDRGHPDRADGAGGDRVLRRNAALVRGGNGHLHHPDAVGAEVRVGGRVLHAPEVRQQAVHGGVRVSSAAGHPCDRIDDPAVRAASWHQHGHPRHGQQRRGSARRGHRAQPAARRAHDAAGAL